MSHPHTPHPYPGEVSLPPFPNTLPPEVEIMGTEPTLPPPPAVDPSTFELVREPEMEEGGQAQNLGRLNVGADAQRGVAADSYYHATEPEDVGVTASPWRYVTPAEGQREIAGITKGWRRLSDDPKAGSAQEPETEMAESAPPLQQADDSGLPEEVTQATAGGVDETGSDRDVPAQHTSVKSPEPEGGSEYTQRRMGEKTGSEPGAYSGRSLLRAYKEGTLDLRVARLVDAGLIDGRTELINTGEPWGDELPRIPPLTPEEESQALESLKVVMDNWRDPVYRAARLAEMLELPEAPPELQRLNATLRSPDFYRDSPPEGEGPHTSRTNDLLSLKPNLFPASTTPGSESGDRVEKTGTGSTRVRGLFRSYERPDGWSRGQPEILVTHKTIEELGLPEVDYDALEELFYKDLGVPPDFHPKLKFGDLGGRAWGLYMPLTGTMHVDAVRVEQQSSSGVIPIIAHEATHLMDSTGHPIRTLGELAARTAATLGPAAVTYEAGLVAARAIGQPWLAVGVLAANLGVTAGVFTKAYKIYYRFDPRERRAQQQEENPAVRRHELDIVFPHSPRKERLRAGEILRRGSV